MTNSILAIFLLVSSAFAGPGAVDFCTSTNPFEQITFESSLLGLGTFTLTESGTLDVVNGIPTSSYVFRANGVDRTHRLARCSSGVQTIWTLSLET